MVTMEKASLFMATWPQGIKAQLVGFGTMSPMSTVGSFQLCFLLGSIIIDSDLQDLLIDRETAGHMTPVFVWTLCMAL